MNETDMRILTHLRRDGRMKVTQISEKLNIPVTTVYDKVRKFDQRHIRKYVPLLDFAGLGYAIKVHMLIAVEKAGREGLKSYLMGHASVNTLQKVNFDSEFLAECVFRNIPALEKFTGELEKRFPVKSITRFHVAEELKQEEFLTDERHTSSGEQAREQVR